MFHQRLLVKAVAIFYFIAVVHSLAAPEPQDPTVPDPPDANDDGDQGGELMGDLLNGITTPIGQAIADILTGNASGMISYTAAPPVANPSITTCRGVKDVCCIWYSVAKDLTAAYTGPTGRCNELARQSIRLSFHDAGTWSKKLAAAGQDFGGADGSFVLFNEITRSENRGLEAITLFTYALYLKYKGSGVGMGDLIQYMGHHAVVTCPLGPRVRAFVGRKDGTKASPHNLLPSVSGSANNLIALFQDKTIAPHELVALVGAHSTSRQFAVSIPNFGKPQDTTPGVWDVSFYNETVQANALPGTFRFASDTVLAADPRTGDEWKLFIGDQHHWNEDFARAYVRMSLIGVNVINQMTECSHTLPNAQPSFAGSSEGQIVTQKRQVTRRSKIAQREAIAELAKQGSCPQGY